MRTSKCDVLKCELQKAKFQNAKFKMKIVDERSDLDAGGWKRCGNVSRSRICKNIQGFHHGSLGILNFSEFLECGCVQRPRSLLTNRIKNKRTLLQYRTQLPGHFAAKFIQIRLKLMLWLQFSLFCAFKIFSFFWILCMLRVFWETVGSGRGWVQKMRKC